MKYYGTTVNTFIIPEEIREKYGLADTRHQYRLVIKASSFAAANKRWTEVTGRERKAFLKDYTSVTGNPLELQACDKYGEVIAGSDKNYLDLKVIVNEINRL